ncbi:Helicase associated domain (HA2) [Popillia japonica]|uniref:RNA helicase n=1 Tax=Popillia japonica TaxID=7064 RepID=A0AAW1MYC4_POPJA
MSNFKPTFLKPSENTVSYLDRNENSLTETTNFVYNKYLSQSIQTQRQRLPIFNNRNHILYLLEKYQTLVLVGETGCGKSTQIPQYIVEAEWPDQVGICQPRRVAALSLASRVAEETGTVMQGDTVGYAVRFDACVNKPKIKYMTEGILIREMMTDPLLKSYSVIMLDEVHERTLYTDILMGLMKKILKKRRELRLIVASATLDAQELQTFFNLNQTSEKKNDSAVIMSVHGRQHPVDIHYVKDPVPCYVQAVVDTVLKINESKERGDILAFLTGQEEVDRAVRLINEHAVLIEESNKKNKMLVVPMYGSLSNHDQLKVFRHPPEGHRKVVIATNVAETSVTIPGIVFVIDCGFVKLKWFNNETHTDSLIVVPVSKASADQRAGRSGRMRPGKAYRLYTEEEAQKLANTTPPEMIRSNLTYVVLQLKALGIRNILKFQFPSPPPAKNLKSALEILFALGAIDINGDLTQPLGYNMAEFPLDPLYSKLLLNSGQFGCSEEILTIVSMLQVETVFAKPTTGNGMIKARVQKRLFEVAEGDLIMYLNVYAGFMNSNMERGFCQKNFINYRAMKRVVEIRARLQRMIANYDVPLVSCSGYAEPILKCIVSGLFPNAAYLHYSGVYKTIRGDVELHVHPDSVLYTIPQPQWVVFCEVLHTTKLFMKDLTVIKSDWLLELAPHFYHKTVDRDV